MLYDTIYTTCTKQANLRDRSRLVVVWERGRCCGKKWWQLVYLVSFWEWWKCLKNDFGDDCTVLCTKNNWTVYFEWFGCYMNYISIKLFKKQQYCSLMGMLVISTTRKDLKDMNVAPICSFNSLVWPLQTSDRPWGMSLPVRSTT